MKVRPDISSINFAKGKAHVTFDCANPNPDTSTRLTELILRETLKGLKHHIRDSAAIAMGEEKNVTHQEQGNQRRERIASRTRMAL